MKRRQFPLILLLLAAALCSSCTRVLGYGVLLWAIEDRDIPSGTILPVYIRSNIDGVWVVGIPPAFRLPEDETDKMEIALTLLELAGGKRAAEKRATEFAPYALVYAETLQDGLPIRENPDNSARRVYRLRLGEIVKILGPSNGNPAISATGDPLPGSWYRVITRDGTQGYCFSYRLSMFEYSGGPLQAAPALAGDADDPELDAVLAKTWVSEVYGTMVSQRRLNIEELSRNWSFTIGLDTGLAQVYLRDTDKTVTYTGIRPEGNRVWHFEGSELRMTLRTDTTLAVTWPDESGAQKTALFVSLNTSLGDLIDQETSRREVLFNELFMQGPVWRSANYGILTFTAEGRFTWIGNDILVPQVIPVLALGSGVVDMRLFLDDSLASRFNGAFSLRFDTIEGSRFTLNMLYTLDSQGLRVEYAPEENLSGVTVMRRTSSPLIVYFYKMEN
jgi:hypothetical protein